MVMAVLLDRQVIMEHLLWVPYHHSLLMGQVEQGALPAQHLMEVVEEAGLLHLLLEMLLVLTEVQEVKVAIVR